MWDLSLTEPTACNANKDQDKDEDEDGSAKVLFRWKTVYCIGWVETVGGGAKKA